MLSVVCKGCKSTAGSVCDEKYKPRCTLLEALKIFVKISSCTIIMHSFITSNLFYDAYEYDISYNNIILLEYRMIILINSILAVIYVNKQVSETD